MVRYGDPGVELSTWYHALVGFPHDELGSKLAKIAGLECHPETLPSRENPDMLAKYYVSTKGTELSRR